MLPGDGGWFQHMEMFRSQFLSQFDIVTTNYEPGVSLKNTSRYKPMIFFDARFFSWNQSDISTKLLGHALPIAGAQNQCVVTGLFQRQSGHDARLPGLPLAQATRCFVIRNRCELFGFLNRETFISQPRF